jgi:hypothetical protein
LLRPKALSKAEQLLLQDALDKELISMECLRGEGERFLSAEDAMERQDPEVEESGREPEGDGEVDSSPAIPAWLGPLADQASRLF